MKKSLTTLITLFTASFFLGGALLSAAQDNVRVCTVAWAPFTIIEGDKISGSHTEKIVSVLKELGYAPVIKAIPWKRCLDMAKSGKIDFVYSASFNDDRAQYLSYPKEPIEVLRYVVVSLVKNQDPQWDGDYGKIPLPVGVPLGFSVGKKLEKNGIQVDTGAIDDAQNFQKLLKGRVKSIIIEHSVLKACLSQGTCEISKIKVHDRPFTDNKAYYLTMSKKFKGSQDILERISTLLKKATS